MVDWAKSVFFRSLLGAIFRQTDAERLRGERASRLWPLPSLRPILACRSAQASGSSSFSASVVRTRRRHPCWPGWSAFDPSTVSPDARPGGFPEAGGSPRACKSARLQIGMAEHRLDEACVQHGCRALGEEALCRAAFSGADLICRSTNQRTFSVRQNVTAEAEHDCWSGRFYLVPETSGQALSSVHRLSVMDHHRMEGTLRPQGRLQFRPICGNERDGRNSRLCTAATSRPLRLSQKSHRLARCQDAPRQICKRKQKEAQPRPQLGTSISFAWCTFANCASTSSSIWPSLAHLLSVVVGVAEL